MTHNEIFRASTACLWTRLEQLEQADVYDAEYDLIEHEIDARQRDDHDFVDWDEQDRRAYQEELIENQLLER